MNSSAPRLCLTAICAALFAMSVGAAPASALVNHPYLGAAAPGIPIAPGGPPTVPFQDACGVAVDSENHLYVADYYGHAIDLLNPPDLQLAAEPFSVRSPAGLIAQIKDSDTANSPCALALDPAGNLYATNFHDSVVRYTPTAYPFVGPPAYGPPLTVDPERSTGVAADQVTSRLYIAHRTHVAAYEPDGDPVLFEGAPLRLGLGSLGDGYGLAVSAYAPTAGYVYVADAADQTVKVYDPAGVPGVPVQVVDGAATPQGAFNDLADSALAVDPEDGHLFVLDNLQPGAEHPAAAVYEFGPSGSYRGRLPHAITHGLPSGLAFGRAGDSFNSETTSVLYVSSGNGEGSIVQAYGAAAPARALSLTRSGSGGGTITSRPAGIACPDACTGEFDVGATVTLTAVDDGHSAFKGWSVVGNPGACPGVGSCQLTLGADTEVSAEFEALPQQTLTVAKTGSGGGALISAPARIDCGATCSEQFNTGSSVTLTALPAAHSAFKGWSVVGSPGACPGVGSCQLTLGADTEVSAEFEALPTRPLMVIKAGSGKGTVTSAPAGIECGAICGGVFDRGSQVVLTASPALGSRFSGWSGAGCAGTGPCEVTLAAAVEVSAAFDPAQPLPAPPQKFGERTLAISVGGSGSGTVTSDPAGIDCGSPCSGVYAPGARITLTASPDPESRFAGWSGCDSATANRCTVVLSASKTVSATFAEGRQLLLGAVAVKGATASLRATVSGPGTLSAAAKGLKPATVRVGRAGVLTLPLALSRTGRKALAGSGRLRVTVQVTFKPGDGTAPSLLTKPVTFKSRSGKK